jgi:heme-degrading monooxygenase HmoA
MKRFPLLRAFAVAVIGLWAVGVVASSPGARVARVWRGYVARQDADAYARLLDEKGIRKFPAIAGNRGAVMWRRDEGDRTEFVVVSYWESKESIRNFTGPEWEKVKPLPEDAKFLVGPPATVAHYEIVSGGLP